MVVRNEGYWSQGNKTRVGYPNSIPSYVEEVGTIAEEEGPNIDGEDVTDDATAMRLKRQYAPQHCRSLIPGPMMGHETGRVRGARYDDGA
jgi:hypothetical protein